MSKKIDEEVSKKSVEAPVLEEYSKSAFVDAAETKKDKLILQVALEDKKKYTRDQVKGIVEAWKKKEVK